MEVLRLELALLEYDDDAENTILDPQDFLIDSVGFQGSTLKELLHGGNGDTDGFPTNSIDPLLEHLMVHPDEDLRCPKLTKLLLSKSQKFNSSLLAKMLLSRRLEVGELGRLYPGYDDPNDFAVIQTMKPPDCSEVVLRLGDTKIKHFKNQKPRF